MLNSQKHREYLLNNRHLYILSIFLFVASIVKAGNTEIKEIETYDDSIIQEISYSYHLISEDQTGLDCCGILGLSLSFPENTKTVLLERTRPHIINPDLNSLHFIVKSEIPITTDLTIPDIYWGTYFRICVILTDDTRIYSAIHSINDYINQADLESLLNSSSYTENISIDKVSLYIKNRNLYVSSPDSLLLSVYDLYGHQIFKGIIDQVSDISLDSINSPFIIATYKASNITQTKKLLIHF